MAHHPTPTTTTTTTTTTAAATTTTTAGSATTTSGAAATTTTTGGELGAPEQNVVDAIVLAMLADGGDSPFGEPEARCLAEGLVREMGLERLASLGITAASVESPDDFLDTAPQEDVELFVDLTLGCIDFRALLAEQFGGLSPDSASCLADGISDGFIRAATLAGITGDEFAMEDNPELVGELFTLMAECLTPEELADLAG
jgi:hypothetical protein